MENSRQKIKSLKNPIKQQTNKNYFIKSETSDSFVNHFDGHFAYLKTLDFYFKMGSDESHFNVSVGSDGQSHKTVSTNHNLFEEKGQPKRFRTEVPLLKVKVQGF